MSRNKGDIGHFNKLWKARTRKRKSWFYRGNPTNQIEYAFGQHFDFLKSVVPVKKSFKCLEVGAGRGSFSAFFADFGCNVTLADLSPDIVKEAELIFKDLGLSKKAQFCVCDALDLKFPDQSFDFTTSIGLLEHFEDPSDVIKEQLRVLKPGGIFTAHVVPAKWHMTKLFEPINDVLRKWEGSVFKGESGYRQKEPLFRTSYDSAHYKKIMQKLGLKRIGSAGVYPYPAISYSPEFPFSLMPDDFEKALVEVFQGMERLRRKENKNKHPWTCDEAIAKEFFIWGVKQG